MFTGNLAEFSLPELFQFLEQGQKTGALKISNPDGKAFYLWLHHGNIVAAAERLDQKGLLTLLQQRNWLNGRVVSQISPASLGNSPLGLTLKSQGILQPDQLKLVFRAQVVGLVSSLFEFSDGKFEFEPTNQLPYAEMTGLSMPATEAALTGLRVLRDWKALAEKLPDPTSGLKSIGSGKPSLNLDSIQERQVWEFATGAVSLQAIAKQLGLAIEKVQQVAFRLIVANVAEEVFLVTNAPVSTTAVADRLPEPTTDASKTAVSKSFLKNLVGFLKTKT